MNNRVSAELDELSRSSPLKLRWRGSRFEWVSQLAPSEIGGVAEQLAARLVSGDVQLRATGFDVATPDGMRIEVKACRKSFSATNIWSWKQIRPSDSYTHLMLIAIEPNRARAFLIPRGDVPGKALSNLHFRGGSAGLFQIAIRNETLPEWITRNEIK